jgi:hypothetical protein
MPETPESSGRVQSPEDALTEALTNAGTVLDEADTEYVIKAVLPVLMAHGVREYDRGLEAGDYFARQRTARMLRLGEVQP